VEKMNLTDEILEHAREVFDVAGVIAEEGGGVLIVGLKSTPDVNLARRTLRMGVFGSLAGPST
jgi:hypothetical protein